MDLVLVAYLKFHFQCVAHFMFLKCLIGFFFPLHLALQKYLHLEAKQFLVAKQVFVKTVFE